MEPPKHVRDLRNVDRPSDAAYAQWRAIVERRAGVETQEIDL